MREIKNAVNNTTGELIYFKGHAKATFMSDGSTVEDAIKNIKPNIDLSEYVKSEELKGYAKAEDIPSLEGYAKSDEIPSLDGYAKAEDIPSVDGFVKSEDLPNFDEFAKTEGIPSLDGYATEEWVNNKNYATEYDLKTIDYSSIKNTPTTEDETGELNITDENGNIGMKVSSEAVYAKDFISGEHKLSEKVNKDYVDNSIAELVDEAPETLNTLNELAAALKDNADIVDVLNQSISSKQDTLVSGTNIKTINGNSLLGSGDITISGGEVGSVNWNDIQYAPSYSSASDLLDVRLVKCMHLLNSKNERLEFSTSSLSILTTDGDRVFNIWNTGDGTKFLSDDGTYKEVYTKNEIDAKIGNINTILESIINGRTINNITFTIEGIEHQAEIGMTWKEWLETDYNTYGLFESSNGAYVDAGDMQGIATYALENVYFVGYSDDSKVKITDEIINNYSYKIIED